jgi:hypothetical protein
VRRARDMMHSLVNEALISAAVRDLPVVDVINVGVSSSARNNTEKYIIYNACVCLAKRLVVCA